MKLTHFTVSNYRSITSAYKIDLKEMTILIGKNNEGKSNLIRALCLAMDIIMKVPSYKSRRTVPNKYRWIDDFPISLQKTKRLKNKATEFRLDFELTEEETLEFAEIVGSNINGNLSIDIELKQDNSMKISVPKRGKGAEALTRKLDLISNFISNKIMVQYIPAIRSEADAYAVISNIIEDEFSVSDDEEYKKAVEYISKYEENKLKEISSKIKLPLSKYIPNIKNVYLKSNDKFLRNNGYMYRKQFSIDMDDGVLTPLSFKGDGIKSLTAMAILSQTQAKSRIIVIDEPENHLHPEANHFLRKVFSDLSSENQIIISTHNPIFVNRINVASNIIVSNGEAKAANRIDEIRKNLGVMISDNLMYSDYVIILEGESDKIALEKYLRNDEKISKCLDNNIITLRSIGGVNNLRGELYNIDRYLSNYLILLDDDKPSKEEVGKLKNVDGLKTENLRYFTLPNRENTELEDLYNIDLYKDWIMSKYQIDISKGDFKNKSKKWSERIYIIGKSSGNIFDKSEISDIKKNINNLIFDNDNWLSKEGHELFENIKRKILSDLEYRDTM